MSNKGAADALRAFGAPSEVVEGVESGEGDGSFEVWPENWPALLLFMDVQTQWNTDSGAFVGLRYEAVEAVMRIRRMKDRDALLDDLRVMEYAALEVMNAKAGT